MFYPDTSVLVAAVAREQATGRIQAWLEEQTEPMALSDWSLAEFASAVAAKLRGGEMSVAERAAALAWLAEASKESASLLPATRTAFRRATDLVNAEGLIVRAADALHLASAAEQGLTLCTLDKEQAEAGKVAGISTVLL